MYEGDRRREPNVAQVSEERPELTGGEHALVHQRAIAEAGKIDAGNFVLYPFAHHIGPPFQCHVGQIWVDAADEQLTELRHHCTRRRSNGGIVHPQITPAEGLHALLFDDAGDARHRRVGLDLVLRHEHHASGVATGVGQVERQYRPEKRIGHLDEDAGAITGVDLGPTGATVLHVAQSLQALLHNFVGSHPLDVGHEADAAGIVLVLGAVQTLRRGEIGGKRIGHGASPEDGRMKRTIRASPGTTLARKKPKHTST